MKQVVCEKKGYRSVYDKLCFGSELLDYGSLSSTSGWIPIRIRFRIRIRIHGFDDQKWEKIYSWNFFKYFFDQKLQFTYPSAFIKNAKLQKMPSAQIQHFKPWDFLTFSFLVGHFCPPVSRFRIRNWIRIRNRIPTKSGSGSRDLIETGSNPNQEHCEKLPIATFNWNKF